MMSSVVVFSYAGRCIECIVTGVGVGVVAAVCVFGITIVLSVDDRVCVVVTGCPYIVVDTVDTVVICFVVILVVFTGSVNFVCVCVVRCIGIAVVTVCAIVVAVAVHCFNVIVVYMRSGCYIATIGIVLTGSDVVSYIVCVVVYYVHAVACGAVTVTILIYVGVCRYTVVGC